MFRARHGYNVNSLLGLNINRKIRLKMKTTDSCNVLEKKWKLSNIALEFIQSLLLFQIRNRAEATTLQRPLIKTFVHWQRVERRQQLL